MNSPSQSRHPSDGEDRSSEQVSPEHSAPPERNRKPAGMEWHSFADHRIREAEAAGLFDNLPGLGRPIPGIDEPLDENWWVKRKLRDEGISVVPPVLEARREVERVREKIRGMSDEAEVRRLLESLNTLIHKAQFSPVPGPADGVNAVDIEQELQRWRELRRSHLDRSE